MPEEEAAAARDGPEAPLVRLERVGRIYRRPGGDVIALDEVSLEIASAELVCVTGPSGSGKSTLLHLLGLLDQPTAGRYELSGEDVSRLDDESRTRHRNRDIGFVFQAFHLVPHLSVAANVELPLAYRGVEPGERRERATLALERVGLAARREHLPDELSGGEQQRVAIARATVSRPRLLLADEPTGNLDLETASSVLRIFEDVRSGGTAVVVVTHSPEVARFGSRRIRLREGRLE